MAASRYRRSPVRSIASLTVGALLAAAALLSAAPAQAAGARISLSPTSGPSGTEVTVSGTGFAKRSTGSVVAGTTSAAISTSASGSFSVKIVIPATSAATVDVTATVLPTVVSTPFRVTPAAAATPSPAPRAAPLQFGVSTPGGARANAELDAVGALAGEMPGMVLSFYDFAQAPPIADLESVAARGATSLLTWEPWLWGAGIEQPAYTNERIASGAFDPYLREWGAALAAWGKPVYLRYAHEMNGDWYPWSEGVNSNAPGSYVAAWRHVRTVVAGEGATNVRWVWAPNTPYDGSTALAGLFPGASQVDIVALDGYNWGTATWWGRWTTPSALFGPGLTALRQLAPGTPILIAETASAEAGGSKAEWNASLVSYLHEQPDVLGFVWFHHDKETNWRIDSTPASASAFAAALAARRG